MTLASIVFAFATSIVMLDVARFVQGVGGAASWAGAMGWLAGAAPREKRGQLIGSAMGAAIAGALFGPVIGVAADLVGHEVVFCTVGAVGVGLMVWTLRTPAVAPLGDGSLGGLVRSLGNGQVRTGLALVTRARLLFGTLSVLGPLRLDELGAGAVAIGATWLLSAALEAIVSPLAGRFSDRRGRLAPLLGGLVGGAITFAILPWPQTALGLAIVIVLGSPVIGLLWAPAMAMLSDGAEAVGLEQGLAFGLMNLTWATGQSLGDVGGARLGQAAGDEVAYLLLAGLCVAVFTALRIRGTKSRARVSTYVHGYDERANERLRDQAAALVDLLHHDTSYPEGARVLEAGCGVGAQTVMLAANSPGARSLSVDMSADSFARPGAAPRAAQRRGHASRSLRAPVRARRLRPRVRLLRARASAGAGRRAPDADRRCAAARRQHHRHRGRPRLLLFPSGDGSRRCMPGA